jgi:hypothetical protein
MQLDSARRPILGVGASGAAALVLASMLGCSPTFDWREARPEGSGAQMLFPCRPRHHDRDVRLGDDTVPMRLHACSAGGAQFALATLQIGDAARITPELLALRTQLLANVGGVATATVAVSLPGATPNPQSARLHVVGKRPDGRDVVADAAFFVKGLTLYQATVLGSARVPGDEAVDTFLGAIRLP